MFGGVTFGRGNDGLTCLFYPRGSSTTAQDDLCLTRGGAPNGLVTRQKSGTFPTS